MFIQIYKNVEGTSIPQNETKVSLCIRFPWQIKGMVD